MQKFRKFVLRILTDDKFSDILIIGLILWLWSISSFYPSDICYITHKMFMIWDKWIPGFLSGVTTAYFVVIFISWVQRILIKNFENKKEKFRQEFLKGYKPKE